MTKFTTNKKKRKEKKRKKKKEKDARSCHQEDKGHQVFTLYRRMIHGPTLTTKQNGHMCRTQPHRITFSRMKDLFVPWHNGPHFKKIKNAHTHRVCYISHLENSYHLLDSSLCRESTLLSTEQALNLPFTKCISALNLHNTLKFMRHFHKVFSFYFLHSPVR